MATYTKVDDVDTAAVADVYGLEGLTLRPLDGGAANSSFKATAEQGSFVLTILDNHDQASARALAAHTEAMFRLDVPTAEVVRNLQGADVSAITGRPVLLKRWIPGRVVDRLPDVLLPAAGELLAHLHGVPVGRVPDLRVGTRRLSPAHRAAIEELPDKAFADWLTDGLTRVEVRERQLHDDQVVCHGDVFTDNLIVRPDDTLALIDWETVSLDGALLDLGMTILGLANVNGALDRHRAGFIIDGYNKHRPLSVEHLAALPQEIEHAA